MTRKDDDLRCNEHDIHVLELERGQWVSVKWNDDTTPSLCLLLKVEKQPATFKGSRKVTVMEFVEKGKRDPGPLWRKPRKIDHGQINHIYGEVFTISAAAARAVHLKMMAAAK